MLHGRTAELARIHRLIEEAATGVSGALVLRGEPGVGKTALLDAAAEHARELPVLRGAGVETEAELPFGALHFVLRPLLDRLDALPGPQADALRGAFGLAAGGADRFLIGVATLTLLAESGPLLCLVDDAQWLDQASADALLFAARRLHAEGVAMLFSARAEFTAPGLEELQVGGLDRESASELLAQRAPGLPQHVRDRVVEESGGNPLALIELPAAQLEDMGPLPLPRKLQEAFEKRIAVLPPQARSALVVAAAEESGELGTILAAAKELGLSLEALREADGLVTVTGSTLTFRHSLTRAAAYQSAGFVERLAVHRALAHVVGDQDRRAWHLAAAATGPDEEAAAGLESAAERARERTGYATAATALERAARLTPDATGRARRLLAAATTAVDAGQPDRARTLADQAATTAADAGREETDDRLPRIFAELAHVRARIEFEHGTPGLVPEILLEAAAQAPDIRTATAMLADAARAAWSAGDTEGLRTVCARLRAVPVPDDDPMLLTLQGAIELSAGDPGTGLRLLTRKAADVPRRREGDQGLRLSDTAQAMLTGDFATARQSMVKLVGEVRAKGMIGWLPPALGQLAETELHLGLFRDAAGTAEEALRIAEDTGQRHRAAHLAGVLAYLAAVAGDEARCRDLAERNLRHFAAAGNASGAAWGEYALAMLDLGLGHWEAALDRFEKAADQVQALYFAPDQVEAAFRLGAPDRAKKPLARFDSWADASGQAWATAASDRCHALPGDERLFERAVQNQDRPFEQARARLLYGEWLRRERRITDARAQLRDALEAFERLGAAPWAEHARAELRAAGETAARPVPDALAALTPQELQVVRLAATGATNKEIGAQLFLSPKTVSHHLYRAFPKLGVATRTELARFSLDPGVR
ncbi:AAA family ATPase [Nonomuraea sp. NPDC050556]|uniref:helix-turn-helix transcriptional regulator n=1 Tax=Nonomuraea sp. NPDC050556 TaxID=3364369 RepID=UPI0037AE8B22